MRIRWQQSKGRDGTGVSTFHDAIVARRIQGAECLVVRLKRPRKDHTSGPVQFRSILSPITPISLAASSPAASSAVHTVCSLPFGEATINASYGGSAGRPPHSTSPPRHRIPHRTPDLMLRHLKEAPYLPYARYSRAVDR